VLVTAVAATAGFVVYYLGSGLSWGQMTGEVQAEAVDEGGKPDEDATDPRRTESGFEFPDQGDGQRGAESRSDNPVADHPVARQRENRSQ
jgi:hypothetical protein